MTIKCKDCDRNASWKFPNEKTRWCEIHKKPGMKKTYEKKRVHT